MAPPLEIIDVVVISGQDPSNLANPPQSFFSVKNCLLLFKNPGNFLGKIVACVLWFPQRFFNFKKEVEAEDAESVTNLPEEIFFSPTTSFGSQGSTSSSTPSVDVMIPIPEEKTQEGKTASSGDGDAGKPICYGVTILLQKYTVILAIPIGNVIVEAVTIAFEQRGGPHSYQFQLVCAGMAIASVLLCLIEIHYKRGNVHFYPEILGLTCAVGQLVLVVVGVILMEFRGHNPVKISIYALVAAVSQVVFKVVEGRNDNVSRLDEN